MELFPKIYDEENTGWENKSAEILTEEMGKEEYDQMLKEQFQDAMDATGSIMSGLTTRLKRSLGLTTEPVIIHDGQENLPRGVGGAGFATVVNRPRFDKHEFFKPGRCFRLRLRHANFSSDDDASLDGRVVCIKLADDDRGGPLDLILHTGRSPSYHNAQSFNQFASAFRSGPNSLRRWCKRKPCNYTGRVDHVRRAPNSYYDQRYYSHVTYEFTTSNGDRKFARFRLIPADGAEESGLPEKEDQENIWCLDRLPTEERLKDYLKTEYIEKLQEAPVQYRLQIQLHDFVENGEDVQKLLNPCRLWGVDMNPWTDVMVLTVGLSLSEETISQTVYSLNNHPETLFLPESNSSKDFASLATAMADLHGSLQNSLIKSEIDDEINKVCKYTVSVVTGKVGGAGTDADVYITLTGSQGRSKPCNLDTPFYDDFEPGQTDTFEINTLPIGTIVNVQMEIRSLLHREWFLDFVSVEESSTGVVHRFPCYRWLTSDDPIVVLRKSDALLARQEVSPYCYLLRKFELGERKQLFQWEKVEGLPSRIKVQNYEDLPKEAQFHKDKEIDLRGKYIRTLTNTGVGAVKTTFNSWENLEDYINLLSSVLKDKKIVKKVATIWQEDKEFGRQILNGPHPIRLRRIISMPRNFQITNEAMMQFMEKGKSLTQEIREGKIYILNYQELDSIDRKLNKGKSKRYVVAPMCLLYSKSNGELMPIAIQLHQEPGESCPVFTPACDPTDWLYAKMWVRLADAQLHQIVSRHLRTHLVMEVFTIATMRNLPSVHPVYKLLIPHLRYTLAVNSLGRKSLYPAEDGLFEKYLAVGKEHKSLMEEAYKKFNIQSLHVPQDLEKRGVLDAGKLPNYFYRDDALTLWKVVYKFVRTMLILHYWNPTNVTNDEELQAWIHDIYHNGFPCWDNFDHGVPSEFSTLDEVMDFVTMVIYTASCQNAALTGGMMDYYAFCPNAPTILTEPPPFTTGLTTKNSIMKSLPSKHKAAEVIAACYTLSRFSRDELFLGEYPNEHFCGDATLATIEAFQEDLKRIASDIQERNDSLEIPYTYLLPYRIPNSISS